MNKILENIEGCFVNLLDIIKNTTNNKKLLFIPHLGLGDEFIVQGAVREYRKTYETVIVLCKERYGITINHMYTDDENIRVLLLKDNNNEFSTVNQLKEIFKYLDYDVKTCGVHTNINITEWLNGNFYDHFYLENNLEMSLRRDNFKLPTFERYKINEEYIIVHDDKERNYIIDRTKIENPNNYKIINIDDIKTDNLFDLCNILENAKELHLMNSSIAILCSYLDCNQIIIHEYARNDGMNFDFGKLYFNKAKFIK